ncbi:MAG TPA: antibiotic biosynthesis monooxygenase [Candidatus Dormibacteraeota bacterium]|nr:antibiotic biosynthesis monooxygenase [Candidatus Dormibacteraeota bacterium]
MIARFWRGVTLKSKADEYCAYLEETGLKEYRATKGNCGVYVFRRIENDRAVFLLLSLWDSYDAIKKFAGPDYEGAVYYPEDSKFLLELEPKVTHYEILAQP